MKDYYLLEILKKMEDNLLEKDKNTMAAIDDLNAAVAAQQAENTLIISTLTSISTQVTALTGQVVTLTAALAAASGNTTDPAVEAAAQAITAGIASVQAEITAVTPVPAPVIPSAV